MKVANRMKIGNVNRQLNPGFFDFRKPEFTSNMVHGVV